MSSDFGVFADAAAGLVVAAPANAPVRKYYIAAERDMWNFAPNGLVDNCTGTALEGDQTVSCLRIAVLQSCHAHALPALLACRGT